MTALVGANSLGVELTVRRHARQNAVGDRGERGHSWGTHGATWFWWMAGVLLLLRPPIGGLCREQEEPAEVGKLVNE